VAAAAYLALGRAPSGTPAAATAGAPVAADAKARTVKLVVLPKDAKIEVGGAPAEISDGVVEITGALGSVHKVRVTAGAASKVFEVVISENGPSPTKVEIEPAAATAPPEATASSTASAHGVAFPGPRQKPAATSAPNPAATPGPTGRTLRDDR
jgi:hypothetical protein